MAGYLSDSSEDGSIYPTTSVMLGYASKAPTDDPFSQLGGSPTWPDPKSPPSADLAKCKTCNNLMSLLLQLNGDLPERFAGHERKLYIFACRSKACQRKSGSIRVVRGIKTSAVSKKGDQSKQAAQQQPAGPGLGDSIFSSNHSPNPQVANSFSQNPFSTKSTAQANPFASSNVQTSQPKPSQPPSLSATFAQKAQIAAPPPAPPTRSPWPTSALPQAYPFYHLDGEYETISTAQSSNASASGAASSQRTDYDMDDSTQSNILDKETFESSLDKPFQVFSDRLAQNPEQILRYEFGGQPLLYSKTDAVGLRFFSNQARGAGNAKVKTQGAQGIPSCENCGKGRVFESQLCPHAITELEAEEEGLDGMDWGTIILGSCEEDCMESGILDGEWGWLEEWVGVQWEDMGKIGKG